MNPIYILYVEIHNLWIIQFKEIQQSLFQVIQSMCLEWEDNVCYHATYLSQYQVSDRLLTFDLYLF